MDFKNCSVRPRKDDTWPFASVSVVTFITMRIASGPADRPARKRDATRRGPDRRSRAKESHPEEVLSIIGYRAGAHRRQESPDRVTVYTVTAGNCNVVVVVVVFGRVPYRVEICPMLRIRSIPISDLLCIKWYYRVLIINKALITKNKLILKGLRLKIKSQKRAKSQVQKCCT